MREAIATGETVTVTGLADLLPGLSSAGASPVGDADVHTAVVLPLTLAGQSRPIGALVLGTSPHLPLDDEYRIFLTLAAGQVAAAVADAQAVEDERRRAAERAELDRSRAQFFTDVAVTLQRAVLGPTVAARTGSPSTTSRPPGRWRWAATGTTSSTCRTAATASSWATSSAVVWPRRRSWASCAAPGGPCCWRATRRRTCSRPWTASPPSSPAPP